MTIPAIEATQLRDLMRQVTSEFPGAPAQPLKVGDVLGGKVIINPEGNRMLMIAGVQIEAKLPSDIVIGQNIKLVVAETTGEKLVLRVSREVTPATTAAAMASATGVSGATTDAAGQTDVAANQTQPSAQTMPPPDLAIPMPNGTNARVWVDPDMDADAAVQAEKIRSRTMVVRYDSPDLGRMDVVLRLDADKLDATVLAPAGEPIQRVRSAVPQLRAALQAAADVPVQLTTGGRTDEAVDVRV